MDAESSRVVTAAGLVAGDGGFNLLWGAESGQCLDVGMAGSINCSVLDPWWWDRDVCPCELAPAWCGVRCCGSEGWMAAGRAEQLHQGEFPARLSNCIPCPCQNWGKPCSFHAPSIGMGSPQVARTLLGFSCPRHVLAPLWRLGEDKHRSVCDAMHGNLLL